MKLLKTSLFSGITTVIRIGTGFIAGKAIALFTGPAGVAFTGQFVNFIAIISAFANGAINNGVVKYTAEFENEESKLKILFSTALRITVISSASVGLVLLAGANFISSWIFRSADYSDVIRAFGGTVIFYSVNSVLIAIINGKKQIRLYTIVNTFGSVIGLILTVVLVYFFGIRGALFSLAVSQSLVIVVTVFLIIKSDWFSWEYFKQPFSRLTARRLGSFSLMAIVTALTMPVSQVILRNLLMKELGVNPAGYWQGMMRISDGYLLLVTTSLSTYYLPKLSALKSNEELRKEILFGYKVLLPLIFISCASIYALRFFIIKTLFTPDFVPMERLFLFQLIGDFFKIAAWVLAYVMVAKAMTTVFIVTEVAFSSLYILTSYFFVGRFQLQGISIAFAVTYFAYLLAMLVIFRNLLFKVSTTSTNS